jgi:hypothetical protein
MMFAGHGQAFNPKRPDFLPRRRPETSLQRLSDQTRLESAPESVGLASLPKQTIPPAWDLL